MEGIFIARPHPAQGKQFFPDGPHPAFGHPPPLPRAREYLPLEKEGDEDMPGYAEWLCD